VVVVVYPLGRSRSTGAGLVEAKTGDGKPTVEALYRMQWNPMVRPPWLMLGSRKVAEDVVQDALGGTRGRGCGAVDSVAHRALRGQSVPVATDRVEEPRGWTWGSLDYRKHAGDAEWLLREAQRKAIYIRDQGVTAAAAMVVDVLNMLQEALGFESVDSVTFWSGE
jgi:hypothetical protein